MFPNAFIIPMSREMTISQWHVPIDDEKHYWYAIFTSFGAPVNKDEMRRQRLELYQLPDYIPNKNKSNDYGFDPHEQEHDTYTGMGADINVHDQWACESMGAIQDRTNEHLGTSDKAISAYRKLLRQAIEQSGMSPHKLQLEITESVLLQNTFTTLATLHELRKMGVQIALDDFGTGYSSLSYLRSFPFDKIKIDRSFIQDLSNGAEPLAIVNAVAGLAKCLNMTSTAEGVETREQMEVLQSIGCTEMQGYLFSKARPAGEIRQFFTQGVVKKLGAA